MSPSSPMPGLLPQAQQQNPFQRIPLWIWIVGSLIAVLIGVLWTLREESEAIREARPKTIPEPVKTAKPAFTSPPEPLKVETQKAAPAVEAEPSPKPLPPGAEVKTESKPVETVGTAPITPPPKPDDLKKVVGIGPKISELLNAQGIFTFEQLAAMEVSYLTKLMEEQEWKIADPSTWPEQARKLAEEKQRKLNR